MKNVGARTDFHGASPLLAIVIIGHNEEANLARCIESCLAADWPNKEIVYCDSESTDRGVEIARRYPIRVIVHRNKRRNPSIGRNVGWRAVKADYVYFIDGDMVLDPGFLARAFPVLLSKRAIACVVGIRREIHPESRYISLIDSSYHNYTQFGEVPSPSGGGGLFKREALVATGGYFEALNCSEEPLLGEALRELGYKTILIDQVMAFHDLGVYSLRDYLRFRARQARQTANMLLLNERTDHREYVLAWKQLGEFCALLAWLMAVIVLPVIRFRLICLTAIGALAACRYKYSTYRSYPRPLISFVEIFLIGKPLHICFQMYYLIRGLLMKDHPSRAPDGQILNDYSFSSAEKA